MSTQSEPIANQLQDAANDASNAASETLHTLSSKVDEGIDRTKEYAQHAVDATRSAAHRVTDTVKNIYQSASAKAEDALVSSKEYVHQHPFPVALGSLIAGLAIGYLIGMARRDEPSFLQRIWR